MFFKRNRSADIMSQYGLLPLLIALLMPPNAALCADSLSDFPSVYEAEVVAYKRGDYAMSLGCGIYALKLQPANAFVRYFLAGSLANLGRKQEAIEQYKQAAACCHDRTLRGYIKLALENLNTVPVPAKPEKLGSKNDAKQSAVEPKAVAEELSAAQQQNSDQEKSDIEARRKEADREIAKIHEEEAVQLSTVEQYRLKDTDDRGRVGRVYEQSPAYTSLFEKLKKENEPRISEINERFLKEKAQIEGTAKLRANAYADASANEKTQLKMGNGLTQVVPLGSNLYVRNIINYGTENRVPELKARTQSLEDASPSPTSKPPTNGTSSPK